MREVTIDNTDTPAQGAIVRGRPTKYMLERRLNGMEGEVEKVVRSLDKQRVAIHVNFHGIGRRTFSEPDHLEVIGHTDAGA